MVRSPERVRTTRLPLCSGSSAHPEQFGARHDFNSLVAQNPVHLLRNIQILPT